VPGETIPSVAGAPAFLARISAIIRRIIGAPDYAAYVEHMRRCHPAAEPVSRELFEQQRLDDRYNRPGSRCC
jgi:uncharacterized short protein YbdD (DUF466 family)